MPGYQVNNAYEGKYQGIDQNEADKKRFYEYSQWLNPTYGRKPNRSHIYQIPRI
jgi:hypothetical protein